MNRILIPNTCQVPNVLLDEVIPRLPAGAVRVLLAIVRFTYGWQKPEGDRISYGQLSNTTGMSRRQVIKGVKALGNLINVAQGAKGRGANKYSLNLNIETGELLSGVQDFTSDQNRTSEVSSQGVVTKTAPFQTHISKPNKTGVEVPESSPSRRGRKLTRRRDPDPAQVEAFTRWYEAYPRHEARADALKAWRKLDPDPSLVEIIMMATVCYAEAKAGTERQYIKQPSSWLNGRRWEDDLQVNATGNGHGKPAEVKDLGNGLVEVDGRRIDQQTYQRRYGQRAN
jgi:Bacteriophage replication protein O